MSQKNTVAFIGAGNMTRCLIQGLLNKGYPKESIVVSNRGHDKLAHLVHDVGVRRAQSNLAAALSATVIILSVKPHFVKEVCQEIATSALQKPLIISLATAITVEDIATWLGVKNLGIVRVMTNIAIRIGLGTTALFANPALTAAQKKTTDTIFNAVGSSFWAPNERDLNTLTPLIGCAPAYMYLLIEALEKAAVSHGIPAPLAAQLSVDVLLGASQLASQAKQSPEALRHSVTTPNGVTAAALAPLLKNNHFYTLFQASFAAALERCNEMEALSDRPLDKPL